MVCITLIASVPTSSASHWHPALTQCSKFCNLIMHPKDLLESARRVVDSFGSLENHFISRLHLDLSVEMDLKLMASLLRNYHASRDPRRYICMREICNSIWQCLLPSDNTSVPQEAWSRVRKSGIVNVLITVAFDQNTYVLDGGEKEVCRIFPVTYRPHIPNMVSRQSYAHHIISVLTACLYGCSRAVLSPVGERYLDSSKALLEELGELFCFLWEKSWILDACCTDLYSSTLVDIGVLSRRILRLASLATSLRILC